MHNRRIFLDHVAPTSDAPLAIEMVRADGVFMYDTDGKAYMDLISGIAVSNIGHGHPKVKAAIRDQSEKYLHLMVYGELIQSPQVQYAKWLTDRLPANLNCVYFVNSGSEATEGALKLAKRYTGRAEIISFRNSYHGSTMGALSAGNDESRKNAFRPLIPENRILPYNDIEALENISENTAAVLIEPIQAEAGVIIPDKQYLKALREKCLATGTILIFDECQTAFGRTGSLFHFEQTGVIPDILTLGKAAGGGMPLGAFIASQSLMQYFTVNPALGHITTFGGHPVCCAAGLAAAQVLEEENLIQQVEGKGKIFDIYFRNHPKVKSFHRSGLFMAVHIGDVARNMQIIQELIAEGIFTDWFLFAADALRLAPPLTISEEQIHSACRKIIGRVGG